MMRKLQKNEYWLVLLDTLSLLITITKPTRPQRPARCEKTAASIIVYWMVTI